MSAHLSSKILEGYRHRKLSTNDLLAADDHLAECNDCLKEVTGTEINDVLPGVFGDHLSYVELESFVDGTIEQNESALIESHLSVCRCCREEQIAIAAMRDLIAVDLAEVQAVGSTVRPGFLTRFGFAELAFASLVLATLAVTLFWFAQSSGRPMGDLEVSPPTAMSSPLPDPVTPLTETTETAVAEPSTDATESGGLPEKYEAEIRSAATAGRIDIPGDVRELRAGNGTLMSGGSEDIPFALLSPVGKIVETDRPTFRWRALSDATAYRVEVYDTNFNLVSESPRINAIAWTPTRRLQRGRTLLWQVTAFVGDREIKSPVRPAPDARVMILDAAKAVELARLRREYPNEHLLLGIKYAKAGLIERARNEFRKELMKTGSPVARRLLRSLR